MTTHRPVRVLRVITRLNVGGPALHATLLAQRLDPERFETLLVAGRESDAEGSMLELGRIGEGVRLERVPSLQREISPVDDLRALAEVTRIARTFRPDIVHTHLAKAGTVGRLAARVSGARAVVHTYHGTVFSGYFGAARSRVFLAIERALAHVTDRIIAITPGQRRDLLALGIGGERKVVEIPLGLELEPFTRPVDRGTARSRLGLPPSGPVVAIVARLVPIKNVALFLEALRLVGDDVTGLVVGDGEQRGWLESRSAELGLASRCRFVGWRRDVREVYAASDLVVLTSLNEGSPVSLLEAMAAARPVVATAVGGVPDVVTDGVNGTLVPSGDAPALAAAITGLLHDNATRDRLAIAGRTAVFPRYDVSRLVEDITRLYDSLLTGV